MIKIFKNFVIKKIYSSRTRLEFKKDISKFYTKKSIKYYINSFGKKNPKKIFYIIQRSPGGGLFSNLNFVIHHLLICHKLNFIPAIDMENFLTKYNSKKKFNKTYNSWEYFFLPVSNFRLKEIYQSKRVIITDSKTRNVEYFDSFQNLNKFHHKIFKKYIKINKKITKKYIKFKKKLFKDYKILGVHFRGSDMKYQERHPFPPTLKQIIIKINENLSKYKYDKIFLVTEEKNYFDKLKKIYKDKLIYYTSYRSKKTDIFDSFRTCHRAKLGEENLIDMLLLKDVDRIICSRSHLSDASLYFNPSLKKKFHIIENGYNSNNILIAQFLWKIKNFLPFWLGGFK